MHELQSGAYGIRPDPAPRCLVTYNRRSWRCTGVGSQGCAHRRAPDLRSVASTVYGDRYTVYGTAVDERDVTVTVILVLYYVHLNVHRVCIPYPASTIGLSTCSAAVPRPPLYTAHCRLFDSSSSRVVLLVSLRFVTIDPVMRTCIDLLNTR